MSEFVHLAAQSHFSLLKSSNTPAGLLKRAQSEEMPAMALCDDSNMFGAMEFYLKAQSLGVKPIFSIQIPYQVHAETYAPIRLYAKNFKGYQELCQLSSQAFKNTQSEDVSGAKILLEDLKHYKDLVLLTGGSTGWLYQCWKTLGAQNTKLKLQELQAGWDCFLEVQRMGAPEESEFHEYLQSLSQEFKMERVATQSINYMSPDDQLPRDVMECIARGKTLRDEDRPRLPSDQYYYKTAQEMYELFSDEPELCQNTLKIAELCHTEILMKDAHGQPIYHLPSFPTREGRSLKDEMHALSLEGLNLRRSQMSTDLTPEALKVYEERLDYELGVLDKMGFNGYFLIVADFIQWAKDHDIPVGPGRGSGAGSLVAYCLKITDLDPIPYNLIFERFLNPERVSMPDFDIDFCQERRSEVIQYVTQTYGQESVCQIITFGKLQARAAIRDVGRVLGLSFTEVNQVIKLIPDKLGISLQEALDAEPRFEEFMEMDPRVRTLMDLALKIEGLVRHAGIHAAGVIIADGAVTDHAPLYYGDGGEQVVQYDMKTSEKIGLIKFDFLGLKTLTHIQKALKLVKINRNKDIKTTDIELEDPAVYEILGRGDTAGIFQFEGAGVTDLILKSKPTRFEDLVAITALCRPGPMEMIPDYLKRKSGKTKIIYLFKELEEILKDSFGIIVYQEHVQLIAAKIASYSLGEADMLRRAMGKKIKEEMDVQKERFIEGARKNNFDLKKSEKLFDQMAEFAKYGFNKSHAAAYCVLSVQTAWLKQNYPVEFYAALLSTEMSNTDNVVKYVKDAGRRGVVIRPPDINESQYEFQVRGNEIIYAFGALKGVGQAAVESLLESRKNNGGSFKDLDDFFDHIDLRKINKKTLESLIQAGAFDSMAEHRAQVFENFAKFIKYQDKKRKDADLGQMNLFSSSEMLSKTQSVKMTHVPVWSKTQRLAREKAVLGFYLSDHPLSSLGAFVKSKNLSKLVDLDFEEPKSQVSCLAIITENKEILTKKGTRMCFLTLEDETSQMEAIVFPDKFADLEHSIKKDQAFIISGELEKKTEAPAKIFVEDLEELGKDWKDTRFISLKPRIENPQQDINWASLAEFVNDHPGQTELYIHMPLQELDQNLQFQIKNKKVSIDIPFLDHIYGLNLEPVTWG